jgi:hypothetical protein
MADDEFYTGCGFIVGGLVFLACWAYAVATYGFFLGVGLGWLPAAVIGVIAGFVWPAIALVGALLGLAILSN